MYFDGLVVLFGGEDTWASGGNRRLVIQSFRDLVPILAVGTGDPERSTLSMVSDSVVQIIGRRTVSLPFDHRRIAHNCSSLGMKQPLIWVSGTPNWESLARHFNKLPVVFHETELRSEEGARYVTVAQDYPDQFSACDVILVPTETVENFVERKFGPAAPIVNTEQHAVLQEFFENSVNDPPEQTCVYHGGLNGRVDFRLIRSIASRLPSWKFKLIGPIVGKPEGLKSLHSMPNIEVLPPMEANHLATELARASVGFVPFHRSEWVSGTYPLKVLELFALGLPVVGPQLKAVDAHTHNASEAYCVANTLEDYVTAIDSVQDWAWGTGKAKARIALAKMRDENAFRQRVLEVLAPLKISVNAR